jgi:hypothetical protein
MAADAMDQKGATFDGTDAPTQNDIERLQDNPSAMMMKAFDEQFGEGAAEKIVGDQGGGQDESESSGPPDNESSEY